MADGHGTATSKARRARGSPGAPASDRQSRARTTRLSSAVAQSANAFARTQDPDKAIAQVLALIGEASGVGRVLLYQQERQSDGKTADVRRHEWDAPGIASTAARRARKAPKRMREGAARFLPPPEKNDVRALLTREADQPLRRALESSGVRSILITPIYIDGQCWGHATFNDCRTERAWTAEEADALKVLAALAGAAIARSRDHHELTAASRIIENSSTLLYRIAAQSPYPIVYASRNVGQYGYSIDELLRSPTYYLELIHPDDRAMMTGDLERIAAGAMSESTRECRIRAGDGRYVWFECRTTALHDAQKRVCALEGIAIDIDRRKATDTRIERYTLTDQLTGLPNRVAFVEQLRQVFAAAQRGAKAFAILYIDLDHFKDINDVLGHPKGDELLKLVAERLRNARRTGDVLARFGGDEFAILQSDVADPSDAGAFAARILRDLADPPYDLEPPLEITASIGIAVFTPDIAGPEDMLKQADVALYRAKDSGRNQFHFHSEELDVAIIERVTLAGDLRRAVDRGEIELYYQPQVEVPSGRIVGLEALARWHHPKRGLLCPSHFIPIAEKTGSILPLGRWALDDVCRQINAWRAQGLRPPTVAINVSTVQLKSMPEFDRDIVASLQTYGLDASAIELELTESVLMETTREHREIIDRLRALGVSIAIDDFGTGYSSLGYLRSYQVSHIKIAQEFVQDIQEDSGDIAIVRAAISLARELGIKVIAEGVETAFQLGLLTAAGCRYIQGYYFSPPVPAAQAARLLRQGTLHGPSAIAAMPTAAAWRGDEPPSPSATPKESST